MNTVKEANPQMTETTIQLFKPSYTSIECKLLPVALLLGIAFDRLVQVHFTTMLTALAFSVFCGLVLTAYLAFNWHQLRWDHISCPLLGSALALGIWAAINNQSEWAALGIMAMFCSLTLFMHYARSSVPAKRAVHHFSHWFASLFVWPFAGMPHAFGALNAANLINNRTGKRIAIGLLLAVALIGITVPLLAAADGAFSYYLSAITGRISADFWIHALIIATAALLLYSYLWCSMNRPDAPETDATFELNLDPLICGIGLGALLLVYALFSAVQFAYLFAGTGLPPGMTYANYAREGFGQMMAVVLVNLILLGTLVSGSQRTGIITAMLIGLICASGLMLASSLVRLNLYTHAYGLTQDRLLAYWGLGLLCAMTLLSTLRLLRPELPTIALCAVAAFVLFAALICMNPDHIIDNYNATHETLHEQLTSANPY